MSFVITICHPEGIIMASDSQSTAYIKKEDGSEQMINYAWTYKLFLAPSKVGIGTYAEAHVQGTPVATYIESFINDRLSNSDYQVDEVPDKILKYFRALPGPPDTGFLIAGYKKANDSCQPHLWKVSVKQGKKRLNSECSPYMLYAEGVMDIYQRLIEQVQIYDKKLQKFKPACDYEIDWDRLGFEGAIEFATFAVKVTSDTMQFQRRDKTVGGPIDVLVIKPDKAFWAERKELTGEKENNL